MTKDLNMVQLTGNLGADPEMRYTAQGSAVTTFRVASNRTWRDKDGNTHEETEWFRIVTWDKLAELCNQCLAKGSRVYVEGRIQTRKWTDSDGVDRYTTEVIARNIIFFSTPKHDGIIVIDDDNADIDDDGAIDGSGGLRSLQNPAPSMGRNPVPSMGRNPVPPMGRNPAPSMGRNPAPSMGRNPVPPMDDDDIPF